jgi:hypothetical protein
MFELHISCTKNIDKLQIDFSDGSSVIQSSDKKNIKLSESQNIDLNSEFGEISQEIITKPEISDIKRSPKIAPELQNFNL